jgi:hypothetical protein
MLGRLKANQVTPVGVLAAFAAPSLDAGADLLVVSHRYTPLLPYPQMVSLL